MYDKEIDEAINTLLSEILNDVITQTRKYLENNRPNPALLIKSLTTEMFKYLKNHPSDGEEYYLLLFNSSIQLILNQLKVNICDETTLHECLNSPGSLDYLSKHPGMRYNIDTVKDMLDKKQLELTVRNPSKDNSLSSSEKPAMFKKRSKVLLGKISSKVTPIPSEEVVNKMYSSWKNTQPLKVNNQIKFYQDQLYQNKNKFLQAGINQHFLEELILRLTPLTEEIQKIAIIPSYFAQKTPPEQELWAQSLKTINLYRKKEAESKKCISLIENLNAIFLSESTYIPFEQKKKIIDIMSRIGTLAENFHSRYKLYQFYKKIIKDQADLEYPKVGD
uniref:hypothetical protein n=1 Tax=Legionella sainthelensi TaxID=28087 RepID=UPI00135CC002